MVDKGEVPSLDYEAVSRRLAQADALYASFPSFSSWSGVSIDEELWKRYAQLLHEERHSADSVALQKATEIAIRAAAVDTGAIEGLYETDRGFTFAVAYQQAGWELAMQEKGEDVRPLFEAQLHAYDMVLDLATSRRPISESWIRQLHEILCSPQDTHKVLTPQGWQVRTLPKGAYKDRPNHVVQPDGTIHSYAPVSETAREMQRLVDELRHAHFQKSHCVLQAAYAHHSFTWIHPFSDGNGRVARALASIFFYRDESVPLVVYADTRDEYLATLRAADKGRFTVFADFVLDRGIDTLGELRRNLKLARTGGLNQSVVELRSLLTGHGELTHRELDVVADRLLGSLETELRIQLDSVALPDDVTHSARIQHEANAEVPEGYGAVWSSQRRLSLNLYSQPPAQANVEITIQAFVATDRHARFPFVLRAGELNEDFPVRLREVFPAELPSFRQKLGSWAELLISESLRRLRAEAQESLRAAGYERPSE